MDIEGGLSVLIITRGRPVLLRACLQSVHLGGDAPQVLVGIDGEDPASAGTASSFPGVETVRLPRMCRGEARNALAARASGRWIYFLDDDTLVPPGHFERFSALMKDRPEASVFGGGQALARGACGFESALYALLASRWGSGPFTARFLPAEGTREAAPEKFILCNLALDGKFMADHGLSFEGHLSSAEENLLLNRMALMGARMVLSGDLNVAHRRRTRLRAFAAQIFSSGRGRAQMTWMLKPRRLSAVTLLPPAAAILAVAAGMFRPALLFAGVCLYLLASALAAALSPARAAAKAAVFALFPVLHVLYAAGWFFGAMEGASERLRGRIRPGRCRCAGRL